MSKRLMSGDNTDGQRLVVMAVFEDAPLHVTLAFRDRCTAEEVDELCKAVREKISLPLSFEFGRHIWVGVSQQMEAVSVSPDDDDVQSMLQTFWQNYNRRSGPSEQSYTYNLHVTLKNDAKRDAVRAIETGNHRAICKKIVIRRVGAKEVLMTKEIM